MITPINNSSSAGKQGEDNKKLLIIKALINSNRPLTRRQLSKQTHLEISSLCQPLFDLLYKFESIRISHYGPCTTTKKQVMHFAIKFIPELIQGGVDGQE
jgi:hypothetical protein